MSFPYTVAIDTTQLIQVCFAIGECRVNSKQQNSKNFNEIALIFQHPSMPSTERNDSLY